MTAPLRTRLDASYVTTYPPTHHRLSLASFLFLPSTSDAKPPSPTALFHELQIVIMSDVYSSLNVSPKKKRVLVKDDNTLTPKKMRLA